MRKTYKELGKIMLDAVGPEGIADGYLIDPTDLEEVGRQALLWNDITVEGELN